VRNVVAGLRSVPDEVRESATAMGYSPLRLLLRIELPLALPAIMAGIRITSVTTIGLVTITSLIGEESLGQLILDGLYRDFRTPLVVGTVCFVALSVVADVGFLGLQWLLTPWARRTAGR
jgi:osmoprotectant transport system permease protein